jgi:hypothetical protein
MPFSARSIVPFRSSRARVVVGDDPEDEALRLAGPAKCPSNRGADAVPGGRRRSEWSCPDGTPGVGCGRAVGQMPRRSRRGNEDTARR